VVGCAGPTSGARNEAIAGPLAQAVGSELAPVEFRNFPDGETYLRFAGSIQGLPALAGASDPLLVAMRKALRLFMSQIFIQSENSS
jgi:hypothetical protein